MFEIFWFLELCPAQPQLVVWQNDSWKLLEVEGLVNLIVDQILAVNFYFLITGVSRIQEGWLARQRQQDKYSSHFFNNKLGLSCLENRSIKEN